MIMIIFYNFDVGLRFYKNQNIWRIVLLIYSQFHIWKVKNKILYIPHNKN